MGILLAARYGDQDSGKSLDKDAIIAVSTGWLAELEHQYGNSPHDAID
jgi:hypothetical protein